MKKLNLKLSPAARVRPLLLGCIAWVLLITSLPSRADLVAAVLPSSRAERVGNFTTFFATMINTSTEELKNCGASVSNGIPGTFWFRPADPVTNNPIGERSTVADIAAGAAQPFYLEFRADAELAPVEVEFNFTCDDANPAPVVSGVNTLVFSAGNIEPIDVVALTATVTRDGIVNIPTDDTEGFFAVSTVNLGPTGSAVARPVGRGGMESGELLICATDRFTGACVSPLGSNVRFGVGRNSVQTFAVFMKSATNIAFDPAVNRVAVEFTDSQGLLRGATSVAVRTADLTIGGVPDATVMPGDMYRFVPRVGRRFDREITFSLLNAPPWLTFSSAGELVGNPTQADAGVYSGIELLVDDGVVTAGIGPFSIEVLSSAWRAGPPLPRTVEQHSMAVVDGGLYYMGGRFQPTSLRQYLPNQNTWTSRTPSPAGVLLGGAQGIGGKIYLLGGNGPNDSSASNLLQIYDPATDDWTQSDPPFDTHEFASATVDNVLYVFGGRHFRTGGFTTNELWLFNTTTEQWSMGPPVPVSCNAISAAAIGRSIYVSGGCNDFNRRHMNVFNVDTGSWSRAADLPVSLAFHQSVALDGKLFVLGGAITDPAAPSVAVNTVYRYDPETNEWSSAQPMRSQRFRFGAAVFEDEIWVTGGNVREGADRTEIYTPSFDVSDPEL